MPKKTDNPPKQGIRVPISELDFNFSRSGGAGGQNVNKVNTKVTVKWKFRNSLVLNSIKKALIAKKLKNRVNEQGELIIYSQSARIQVQNKKQAIQKMNELVDKALIIKPRRKLTKVPRRIKEKRLKEKKIISIKKQQRRGVAVADL